MKRILLVLLIVMVALFTTGMVVSAETESEVVNELSAWESFVNEYFTSDKVAMYMSWLAYIGTIIGLVANLNKLKKEKILTLENVSNLVSGVVTNKINEEFEKFLPNIIKAQEKTNDVLKCFSKVLALAQENTPESRVAILNIIEELGTAGQELIDSSKQLIADEIKSIEEHKEIIDKKCDTIINEYDGTSI